MTTPDIELDDLDRALALKIMAALRYFDSGEPLRDFVDEDDIVDSMRLMLRLLPNGDRVEIEVKEKAKHDAIYGGGGL